MKSPPRSASAAWGRCIEPPTRIYGGGVDIGQGPEFDVARDGRFLINTVLNDATAPITLLQNWNPESKP